MTKEKIHQLLATQRFSDQTIAPLEQYLKQQVDTSSVDSEALLALLKLYALYPGKSNNVHTATILAKLLTTLPSTDFQTALCLIPLRIVRLSQTPHLTAGANIFYVCLPTIFSNKML
eukprot:c3581_g1_i2.p1 GENE.c3581_g1_i2~~c3581_g1_i2.p1  ORF type:complete len:134 (-),score=36.61 c3581_g1_i2:461-811(-)